MSEKRILIVEDSREYGRLVTTALGTLDPGIRVDLVPSAEQALLEISRSPVDLLVIDVRLPGISGLELTRRVRVYSQNTRVIQMTGLTDPQLEGQALQTGADAFFTKPFEMNQFLETVGRLLGLVPEPPPAGQEPAPEAQEEESPTSPLNAVLTGLRQSLGAEVAALVGERGLIIVQAGELPDRSMEGNVVPSLMVALSASEVAAHLMDQRSVRSALAYRGESYNLVIAQVIPGFAVLVALKAGESALRLAIALEEALNAQKALEATLARLGITGKPAVEKQAQPKEATQSKAAAEEPAAPDKLIGDLQALLDPGPQKITDLGDVEAFWEKASEPTVVPSTSGDAISYDQAMQLGLVPDKPDS